MTIATAISKLQTQIQTYENRYGRPRHSVQLIAVCKGQPISKILAAYSSGMMHFAESYTQEALLHQQACTDKAITWHFIGPIQSNKTRLIAEHFAWVHSVAHLKIATRLNDQRPDSLPPLNICIQVNISQEMTKSGIAPEQVLSFAQALMAFPRLKVRGLMAIPAPLTDLLKQRHEFNKLAQLLHSLQQTGIAADTLSMGMSNDVEAAIAEGATFVRIGKSIFNSTS